MGKARRGAVDPREASLPDFPVIEISSPELRLGQKARETVKLAWFCGFDCSYGLIFQPPDGIPGK